MVFKFLRLVSAAVRVVAALWRPLSLSVRAANARLKPSSRPSHTRYVEYVESSPTVPYMRLPGRGWPAPLGDTARIEVRNTAHTVKRDVEINGIEPIDYRAARVITITF